MVNISVSSLSSDVPGIIPMNVIPKQSVVTDLKIKTYKRRFWMLFLFVLLTTLSAAMFPLYVSVANVTGCYYGVSQSAVNWTMQIQMLVYIVLVFPASFLMDYLDLRWTLVCASCLNVAACGFQFLSLKPNGFVFVIVSCFLCAVSSMLVIGAAPHVAARWFPVNELSRACSFGNFGNIVGVSIGLMLTPLMISSDCGQKSLIEDGKRNLAYALLAAHSVSTILIVFTFQNSPKLPPSLIQLEKKKEENAITKKVFLDVITNKDFIVLFIMSGINGAVFYAFTTTANNLMIRYFPNQEVSISWMTTLYTVTGLGGAICAGYIMDYTHKFKQSAMVFTFASLVFYILFSCTLQLHTMWIQYIFAGVIGFFLTGLLPIELEYAIEILFPITEIISANFIFWALQAFGLILIEILSQLLENYGPISSCSVTGVSLAISFTLSCFLTKNYKRNNVCNESTTNNVA